MTTGLAGILAYESHWYLVNKVVNRERIGRNEAVSPPPSSVYLIAGAASLLQLAVRRSTVAKFSLLSTPPAFELGPRKRIDCLRGRGGGNRREKADFFFLVSAATEGFQRGRILVGTCGITASERGASLRAYGFYPLVVMARTMLFGVRRKERVSFFGSAGVATPSNEFFEDQRGWVILQSQMRYDNSGKGCIQEFCGSYGEPLIPLINAEHAEGRIALTGL
ncbi:hypothetical protein M9H77_02360 [Catharanthus roseus]|uniref:Uncharacterized protein n=1 Tax=Catharanthus roseus TaxID=4058 RepID=A0ACC0C8P7_CATRO|nr:hypothetical protein M9H77_02360 [Catharanthus roseus]